jgi:hypothetical protein
VIAARKVGEGMAVQREWDLRTSSYFKFISLILPCAKCGNGHALFVLGLVKFQPLSLIFPNYLALLSMYLMLIFCRRNSTDEGKERPGCNTYTKPWTRELFVIITFRMSTIAILPV